jgi:hypothetical protein
MDYNNICFTKEEYINSSLNRNVDLLLPLNHFKLLIICVRFCQFYFFHRCGWFFLWLFSLFMFFFLLIFFFIYFIQFWKWIFIAFLLYCNACRMKLEIILFSRILYNSKVSRSFIPLVSVQKCVDTITFGPTLACWFVFMDFQSIRPPFNPSPSRSGSNWKSLY